MTDIVCPGCQRGVWECVCDAPEPKPEPKMFETSPDHWNDRWNDLFVDRWLTKMWRVTRRDPGNKFVILSKHRKLSCALAAAERIA